MNETQARNALRELVKKGDLDNNKCADCLKTNPQWASLSFAVFLCDQCAGAHRGYGVHISFVRSLWIDSWKEDQVNRMKVGGNAPFLGWLKAYPENGGFKEGMTPYERYHCWASFQYKDKLDAQLAGSEGWSPSPPPANFEIPPPPSHEQQSSETTRDQPSRPSSAQGFSRKIRELVRRGSGSSKK